MKTLKVDATSGENAGELPRAFETGVRGGGTGGIRSARGWLVLGTFGLAACGEVVGPIDAPTVMDGPGTMSATLAQQAYIKASNTGADDQFGFRVSLSADGST